jgi:hypothetical protein
LQPARQLILIVRIGEAMDTVARLQRLVDLIAQARALSSQSPVSCFLLQTLAALSDEEAAELGTRQKNKKQKTKGSG